MDPLQSTFEFHRQLESLTTFCRRERLAIALFGGGFCAVLIAAVFLIDPAFFYPRLQTDPLNYWLKARHLVDAGNTAAKWAVNLPPFPYAAMPGVLRTPALYLFSDFDTQLRAIQLVNVFIVAAVALLSAYILSWSQPPERSSLIVAFSFTFTLFSPIWLANVFLPLADAPFAFFSLAAIVAARRVLTSPVPLSRQTTGVIGFFALFAIAFSLRFTAPAILVFAAILLRGRWTTHTFSRRSSVLITAGVIAVVALLVAVNRQALFGRYLTEPLFYLMRGEKRGILLNLLGAALPSEIVPNFASGFINPPVTASYSAVFWNSPWDLVWMVTGIVISLIIVGGALLSRARFLPEIAYVLLPLPVLAVILPSASRYVMTYQPFFWIFFLTGAAALLRNFGFTRNSIRTRATIVGATLLLGGAVIGLRVWRTAGTASIRGQAVSFAQLPRYVTEVAETFGGLRRFLESLPRGTTLLVGQHGEIGRWKAISNLDYYSPDSTLATVAAKNNVYVLAECGMLEVCTGFEWYKGTVKDRVSHYGKFRFDSVYAISTSRAKAQVYRLTPEK